MKSELTEVSPTRKELKIEIDATTLKDAYGKVSQKYAKGANVPGFRRGYAPVDVVRLRFKEEIRSDVLQEVIPSAVNQAITDNELHPLTEPQLHLDGSETAVINGSQPLSFHVHVEVMPEIPETNYEGMNVTRRVKPVSDAEIDDLLAERLNKEAALIPVEGRSSEKGDTIIADLEGRFADKPDGEPITANDLEIVLGDEVIEPAFTENLVGVNEDEEKEFTVTYPEGFSSKALAGKTVHYTAKIKSIGRTEVPELNDEWANSVDEGFESLDDLRKRMRSDLEKIAQANADTRVRNDAVAKLIETNSFEVPDTLIENQARNLLNNFAHDLQQRGVDLKQVEPSFIEMAYHNMRTQAERDVRGAMLLEQVGLAEQITISDGELDEEIGKMAEYYHSTSEEIRASLEKQGGGVENIRHNLKTRKTIEAVVSKATITEGEWTEEQPEQPAAAEKPKKAAKKKKA
jgi:trigger factor